MKRQARGVGVGDDEDFLDAWHAYASAAQILVDADLPGETRYLIRGRDER